MRPARFPPFITEFEVEAARINSEAMTDGVIKDLFLVRRHIVDEVLHVGIGTRAVLQLPGTLPWPRRWKPVVRRLIEVFLIIYACVVRSVFRARCGVICRSRSILGDDGRFFRTCLDLMEEST